MTDHDSLTRFLLPHAVVRGIHVSLNETWSNIQEKTHYPAFVSRLLGEAVVAAALFANHTKVNGRLSVALHSKTALRTLFAECTTSGTLRGTVHMAEDISHSEAPTCLRELDHNALLAITVESSGLNPDELQRHQSLIALDAANLTEAFEIYCRDSEQTPIRILLAAEGKRAAGLLLQNCLVILTMWMAGHAFATYSTPCKHLNCSNSPDKFYYIVCFTKKIHNNYKNVSYALAAPVHAKSRGNVARTW